MTLISTLSAFSARFVERVQRGSVAELGSAENTRRKNGIPAGSSNQSLLRSVDDAFQPLTARPREASAQLERPVTERVPIGRRGDGDEVWFETNTDAFTGLTHCSQGSWVRGNLGRACLHSAAATDFETKEGADWRFQGPAMVFDSEEQLVEACEQPDLERSFVAILRFQGRKARGHVQEVSSAVAALERLQQRGHIVALVTDGDGGPIVQSLPVADNLAPEALCNGTLRRIRPGDLVRIDVGSGQLDLMVDEQRILARDPASPTLHKAESADHDLPAAMAAGKAL